MVVGSSPVAVTSPSDFAPASSKEFLDIQATIECGFTLKRVRDMIKTYSLILLVLLSEKLLKNKQKQLKIKKKKQIEAIQDNKKQLTNINDDYKNKSLFSKEREIFKNIYNERLDKIEELNKKIDHDNPKYIVKTIGEQFEFHTSEDPIEFFNDINTGKISLEEAKKLQKEYEEYLKKMRKRNKSDEQKKDLANINVLFNARNNAIKFIEDYGPMILEAKRLAKQEGKRLKILTPK